MVTRALGPDGRGVHAWLLTLAAVAVQVALLAPPHAVRALAGRPRERLPATLAALCGLGAIGTLPLAAYALLDPVAPAVGPSLVFAAWLSVPLTATALALFALLQTEARATPILLVQTAPRAFQLAVVLALAAGGALDLPAAVWLHSATALATLGLTLLLLRPSGRALRPDPALARDLSRHLGLGWVSALALFCTPRVSVVALGWSAPVDTVGQYGLALALQEAALAVPTALGGALIAHVGLRGAPAARRDRVRAAALALVPTAGVCLAAALLAPVLVPLVFGSSFAPAAALFQGLLATIVPATLFQLCQPLLIADGRPLGLTLPALAAFSVAIATAIVAIPHHGAWGAVGSNVAGFLTLAALGAYLSRGTAEAPPRGRA